MTIIAPIGYARVGKDEFAKVLVEEYGFVRFAFADKLRECLYALNPIINIEWYMTAQPKYAWTWRLQDVIEQYGWDGYKSSPFSNEIRRLLQRFGTEVGRDLLDEDIWLKELDKVKAPGIVVTDARFPNELDYILNKGGKLIHIARKGVNPINAHISETAHRDYISRCVAGIDNDKDLEYYRNKVRLIADRIDK